MDRPSKTFSRAGFYLILLFSFCAPIFPNLAYILAAAAFMLWVLEQLIFRNTDWTGEPMFYPLAGFTAFLFISFIVSNINYSDSIMPFNAYLAIFYFVVHRFVPHSEKRKMILWTFIAGVILSTGIKLIIIFGQNDIGHLSRDFVSEELSYYMTLIFVIVLSFFSESENWREKFFFGLLSLPVAAVAIVSANQTALFAILLIMLLLGVFKDKSILITFIAVFILYTTGIFELTESVSFGKTVEFLISPFVAMSRHNLSIGGDVAFYGANPAVGNTALYGARTNSYFLKLLIYSGPSALILIFWIFAGQVRRSFTKFRKVTSSEMKIYYLNVVLTVIVVVILNLYGSSFETSAPVLVFWMLLGMSEI